MSPKAAFVCALLALFSAGSQGNKEANNHRLASSKERVLRFVGQPAVFRRDSGSCSDSNRRLQLLLCDEKFIEAVFSDIENSNCTNEIYNYTSLFSGCGTNRNGAVCASIEDSIYGDLNSQCRRSFYTSECSSGCQMELRRLSDSVGCCVHNDKDASTPSVWMNCNIQQPEVCADTPNIADVLAKKRNIDPCTVKCSLRQAYYTYCKYLSKEYEKLNRECGMEDALNFCGFDKGEFCITMDYYSHFETVSDECYSDSEEGDVKDGVCSTKCRNALEEMIDRVGCCFVYFNSSFSYHDGLSMPSFSACGIKVPDACNSFNSRDVPSDFLECAGITINSGATLRSEVYSIGLIIIGLIAIYI